MSEKLLKVALNTINQTQTIGCVLDNKESFKERLNKDDLQYPHCQENKQSPLTPSNTKKNNTYGVGK